MAVDDRVKTCAPPTPWGALVWNISQIYFLYNSYINEMAYRRNFRKSYRPRRYRRTYRRRRTPDNAWKLAYSSYKLGKRLARLVNVEKKIHESYINNVPVPNTGARYSIWGSEGTVMNAQSSATGYLAQGDSYAQRDGISIKPMSIRVVGNIVMNTSATTTSVRVILVKKDATNATAPLITDYLNSADVFALKNWDERFRFQTLYDKTWTMTAGQSSNNIAFDFFVKLTGHVGFTQGTHTCEQGGLYLMLLSDEPPSVSGGFPPDFTVRQRSIFVDN